MSETTNILITGVSRGLGKALTEVYLRRPDHIVIGSLRNINDTSHTEALKALPTAPGSRLILVQIANDSLTDPYTMVEHLKANGIDHLDVIIANAAGMATEIQRDIDLVKPKDLSFCFDINARSTLILFQATKSLLEKAKVPKWVSVSSVSGSIASVESFGTNAFSAYGISKAALNWITVAIHVNCKWLTAFALHPGFVQTGMGNMSAQSIGMEQAPNTVEESIASIISLVDGSTREKSSGKFFNTLSKEEIPW